MRKLFIGFAALVTICGSLPARAATPAEEAFAKLKSLAGTWQNVQGEQKSTVTYTVRSAGTSVEEISEDMVTVYHLDGDSILMTHYCSLGNQPRLRATRFALPVQSLEFAFQDITNDNPAKGHISSLKIEWIDENHLKANWGYTSPEGKTGTEVFELERVKASTTLQ